MMNTKVYKSVHDLAGRLMEAAERDDNNTFELLYVQLNQICIDNENTPKDHPVQWETLADFTEELEDALIIYTKALEKSIAINSKDHMSSIGFSMASLQIELGQNEAARTSLQNAKVSANKISDLELKQEIHDLLESLTH
ncbi:tetratricopeptide repeat protein [Colwellia sp. 20A7]|uniref:tetratricopeptide repeat protein n=1 Tax=Colwellia sp. 20A7 TaxID=2689569 RepID=UPI0013569FB0|nr:tetratricopeptide repeat protein [Colwellia sp. 20A7]